MDTLEAFKKFTKRGRCGDSYTIECRLGLWGVTSWSKTIAESEARHYFIQYYTDGEYNI